MNRSWPLLALLVCAAAHAEADPPRFRNLRLPAGGDVAPATAAAPAGPAAPRRFSTVLRPQPAEKVRVATAWRHPSPAQLQRLPTPRVALPASRGLATTVVWAAAAALGLGVAGAAAALRRPAGDSEVISMVAHELKSPLSAIESYLDLMLREGAQGDTHEVRQWLQDARHLKSTASHLQGTITDLHSMTHLQSGKIALQRAPLALEELAAEAVKLYAPRAHESGVTLALRAEPLPSVSADKARLRQVLHNLLSNAVKFTPKGGRVEVSLAPEDGGVRCTVADSGVGIADKDLPKLFGKFVRLAPAEHGREGTGLGLFIAKTIVVAHGGRIWAESEPRVGSRFHFTVPGESRGA